MELEESIKTLQKFCEYDDNLFLQDEKLYEYQDAIETVLQALKQTQKNYELAIKQNITYKQNIHDLKYNSIPKKKIENEIEILKAQCGGNIFHIQQTLNAEIRLLQDLLKDK